eukprot:TRINITY_DN69638_c0_g1_i1.p1 TRINITY_DN69638_c0_g1~~TRINITY_DN69638_c0_g1_i1.p1  ORF type:complete len:516 (-),score=41.44 TRINITY_DN69638_c0_g1_i1:409-1956(-)
MPIHAALSINLLMITPSAVSPSFDGTGRSFYMDVPLLDQCQLRAQQMEATLRKILSPAWWSGVSQKQGRSGVAGAVLYHCCANPEDISCWGNEPNDDFLRCCWGFWLDRPSPAWMRNLARHSLTVVGADPPAWQLANFDAAERDGFFRFCRVRVLGGEIIPCDVDTLQTKHNLRESGRGNSKFTRAMQLLRALTIIHEYSSLPEGLDLLVSLNDFESVDWPAVVVAPSKGELTSRVALVPPLELMMSHRTYVQGNLELISRSIGWHRKVRRAFFRGSHTDLWSVAKKEEVLSNTTFPAVCARKRWRLQTSCVERHMSKTPVNWMTFPRGRLVELSLQASTALDARFSRCSWQEPESGVNVRARRCVGGCVSTGVNDAVCAAMEAANATSLRSASWKDHVRHRYVVVPDGAGYPGRLYWLSFSNSVMMIPRSSLQSWGKEGILRPFEHYLPLRPDMSDILEVRRWAEKNSEAAKDMAVRAQTVAWESFTIGAVLQYWREFITVYAEILGTQRAHGS